MIFETWQTLIKQILEEVYILHLKLGIMSVLTKNELFLSIPLKRFVTLKSKFILKISFKVTTDTNFFSIQTPLLIITSGIYMTSKMQSDSLQGFQDITLLELVNLTLTPSLSQILTMIQMTSHVILTI